MRLLSFGLRGIRSFEDPISIDLGNGCNIFVGQNNAGKSTLLKSITCWQMSGFDDADYSMPNASINIVVSEIGSHDLVSVRTGAEVVNYVWTLRGAQPSQTTPIKTQYHNGTVFGSRWPDSFIIPYSAKRKASTFEEGVTLAHQNRIDGTFSTLYARIDRVASPGSTAHEKYKNSVENILGFFVGTRASINGKTAGVYLTDDRFVTIDRMGDGVSEITALLVDLSLAKGKLFVLEEPETNLHPKGLKALLAVIRESAAYNQFIVATHSNIVVRELGADASTRIFRVHRDGDLPSSPSRVDCLENDVASRSALLRELGYEFVDFDLHDAWLFLEEASAESIVRDILIPYFAPSLMGRLRTFSVAGVSNLEPSISEFQRLVTFVHLQPAYRGRIWIRSDGDEPGIRAVEEIRLKFPYLDEHHASTFAHRQFEMYYPPRFQAETDAALAITDKRTRASAKSALLNRVLKWSSENPDEARPEWQTSALEPIELLQGIATALRNHP